MDLSEQPTTRPELLSLLDRTMRAASAQRVLYSHALAQRLGLRQTDLECLFIITLNADVTPGRLAAETGLTTGAITGVVDRIERAGYVRRERDPADRRRIFLRPVSERIEGIRDVNRDMRELWMSELKRYDDAELAFLVEFARRNYRSAVEATARMQKSVGAARRNGAVRPNGPMAHDAAGPRREAARR
ncbi:MAG: MarR family transcriptional regulator [Azospirillaceae bacterium]